MRRMKRYIIVFALALLGGALIIWVANATSAQVQDVKVVVPVVYQLTAQDSQAFAQLQAKKAEAERTWAEANTAQLLIMADAGIPRTERDRKPVAEGDHFVFYPKPTPMTEAKKP